MRNLHEKQSAARPWLRPALGLGTFGVATFVAGLLLGLHSEGSPAVAQEPARHNLPDGPEPSSDYAQRVVAYIYGNVAVTREELGEYLIARFGPDKLELLVNKKIIEHACRQKGVEVTPAELELALETDCAKLGVTKDVFLNQVLRERKVTLYEWKEDVLKPQILLSKLCQDRVQATEDEIRTKAADLLVAVQSHQPAVLLVAPDGAPSDDELWQMVAAFTGNASSPV